MQPESDEQLLERIRDGSRDALARLYERYKGRLYAFCFRLLKNEAKAEDAVHDTFVKICNGAYAIENAQSFRPWIFRVARNEAFTMMRHKKSAGDDALEDLWDDNTPLSVLTEKDLQKIVQRCVDELKIEYREVLMLREYEQLSYEQIAMITGNTESSVKSRIFKARKALAKKLEPWFRERVK